MKKRVFLIALAVICLSLLASGTLAYFTDEDKAENVITTGGFDIEVEEWQIVEGERLPYPNEPVKVMPGTAVSKIVTVKNEMEPAFVRVRYDIIFRDSDGKVIEIDPALLSQIVNIPCDSEQWITRDEDDGWFYYASAVEEGEATSPLFEEVVFSAEDMKNEFKDSTFEINVYAQAVQAANNSNSALEATGWPVE